jgi:hypothetical protein
LKGKAMSEVVSDAPKFISVFRHDMAQRNRELLQRREFLGGLRIAVTKKIMDAMKADLEAKDLVGGGYSDTAPLEEERAHITKELNDVSAEIEALKQEKIRLIEEAGLRRDEVPASLDELPISPHDFVPHLHGIRSPQREKVIEGLKGVGLLQSYKEFYRPEQVVPW